MDGDGTGSEWSISLTLNEDGWGAVGEVVPRLDWPEVTWAKIPHSTERLGTMSLPMGTPSRPELGRLLDLDGRSVGREQALARLTTTTRILVSVSGEAPDEVYRLLPTQAEFVLVLAPKDSGVDTDPPDRAAAEFSPTDENEDVSNLWSEEQSQNYYFELLRKGKSFELESDAAARRYLRGVWRLDRRAHVGGGHYVHADRGDDVTVLSTDDWLIETIFNHGSPQVAESVERIRSVRLGSDGIIQVNGRERFMPLDEDHVAVLGYDFIAVVRRQASEEGR